jgi:hypothetical protein
LLSVFIDIYAFCIEISLPPFPETDGTSEEPSLHLRPLRPELRRPDRHGEPHRLDPRETDAIRLRSVRSLLKFLFMHLAIITEKR